MQLPHTNGRLLLPQSRPQQCYRRSLLASMIILCLSVLLTGCRSETKPEVEAGTSGQRVTQQSESDDSSNSRTDQSIADPSGSDSSDSSGSSDLSGSFGSEPARIPGRNLAIRAKDQLAASLMSRLVEAMVEAGPAGAIEVCSQEAPSIAERVGKENGVRIGRTSFRIRNPENTPPAWALPWVEQRVESPQFQILDSGATAALFPIRIQPTCLACHGNEIQAEIGDKLTQLYPNDRATGFALDELRGWVWVEVPRDVPSLEH
jgi:hypothetical protein